MKTSDLTIGHINASVNRLNNHPAATPTPSRKNEPLPVTDTSETRSRQWQSEEFNQFSILENKKIRFQHLSQQIEKISKTMETVERYIGAMETSLNAITKQFPPYPPESTERIELLRQFNTLRKMIDQLTIPVDDIASLRMQVPAAERQGFVFFPQPLHTGKNSLDIPEVEMGIKDEQLPYILEKINAAHEVIKQHRMTFTSHADRIISQM